MIMKKLTGPDLLFTIFFVCLGLIMIALNIKEYKKHAHLRDIAVSADVSSSGLSVGDLEAMFAFSAEHAAEKYEIIAKKNLFSPERRASEPALLPGVENTEPEKTPQTQRVNPESFKLYGITLSSNSRMALIYHRNLSDNRPRLLREGEAVFNSRDGKKAFEVVGVRDQSVLLRVNDEVLEIGLYGQRQGQGSNIGLFGSSIIIGDRHEVVEDE